MRSPSVAATSSAVTEAGRPEGLALVAVMHSPKAADSERATACAGTRTPSVPRGASAAAIRRAAGTTIVSGPGQNAAASRRSSGPKPLAATSSAIVASAAIKAIADAASRPLTANRRSTAASLRGSTARP